MKFYDYTKRKYRKTSKLFGITIFEQIFNHLTTKRYQYFLNGIVTTYKVRDIYDNHVEKVVKIFGSEVLRRVEDGDNCYWYSSGKLIRKISAIESFKTKYIKYFDKKYDDIYVITANSGESFLFLTYVFDALCKKMKSANPLIVATKKYHTELIKMICPNVPYIYIKAMDMTVKNLMFKVDKFRIFSIFPHEYFLGIEVDIKKNEPGSVHYFNSMLKYFGLEEADLTTHKIDISREFEDSMLKKVKALNLNLSNFIFLAPEASSCKLLDSYFWKELIDNLSDLKFDIFVNLTDTKFDLCLTNYKTCYLSTAEAFALAKRAKKIVSLRSGFSEVLLQTGTPMYIIYNKFGNRRPFNDMSIKQVMSGFSLKKLPRSDNNFVYEYEYDISNGANIIQNIMNTAVESVDNE